MARIDRLSPPRISRLSRSQLAQHGALGLILIPSLAVLFAQWFWLADVLSFFRPLLLGLSLLVLLLLLPFRRGVPIAVAAVLVILNLVPLTVHATASPALPAGDTQPLRVMSANLDKDSTQFDAFRRVVAQIRPDVLVTQETSPPWVPVLLHMDGLPHQGVEPSSTVLLRGGTQIISRYPVKAMRVGRATHGMQNAVGGGQALRAEVRPPDRKPLVLYVVHAPTPRTLRGWQRRTAYFDEIAALVAAEPPGTQVIVVGDWNTPPWSPLFRRFITATGLASAEALPWPPATRRFLVVDDVTLLGTPIDRVAVSSGIGVAGFHLGPDFGSDHVPVYADLTLH